MARQSTTPVQFNPSRRKDEAVLMSSGRAGVVQPVAYIPLLPGDSCAGKIGVDIMLKEMPKPLLNGVTVNFQAWFVPKSAHPRFFGRDEVNHALTGRVIKTLGNADRTPPPYFHTVNGALRNTATASDMFKRLGLHTDLANMNTDLIDAFALVYNFRLAAHSSKLPRRKYAAEDIAEATTLPPAFWVSSRFRNVVPDYERALVVGALDLDVAAGAIPVRGIGFTVGSSVGGASAAVKEADGSTKTYTNSNTFDGPSKFIGDVSTTGFPQIFAEMAGQQVSVTLADIDKARTTQSFAKLMTAYAGNDTTGFDNADTLVALLMRGIAVEEDDFKRPWLLASKVVGVGFAERHATDGANLDASVTTGRASAMLPLNVPQQDVGGMIIVTVEMLPERIDERMQDEYLLVDQVSEMPNALRDVQRTEPVDLVPNRRVDAKHANPGGLYGYEPMNDKWNRSFTRLGGDFYMATPGGGWTENRSNIWQTEIVNPTFSATHYLAPQPFPHDVFADPNGDAFEVVARHSCVIVGLTQIGDVLAENNDEYEAVANGGLPSA